MSLSVTNLVLNLIPVAIFCIFCSITGQAYAMQSSDAVQQQDRLLVFSKTTGWRHQSIEAGQQAIKLLGQKYDVGVTVTEDASMFNADTLAMFSAVIFLNTTGTIFDDEQRSAFEG